MISHQLPALVRLYVRHLLRMPRRAGDPPSRGFPTRLLLTLTSTAFVLPYLWQSGAQVHRLGSLRLVGAQVAIWGLLLLGMSGALALLSPEIGKVRSSPLRHTLLDELPLSPFSIAAMTWLQNLGWAGSACAYLAGVNQLRAGQTMRALFVLGFSLGLTAVASAVGLAVVSLIRVSVPAERRTHLAWLGTAAIALGVAALFGAPYAGAWALVLARDPSLFVARALLESDYATALCTFVAVTAPSVAVFALCERRGYDRIDSAPGGTTAALASTPTRQQAKPAAFDMGSVERLLGTRESGTRALWIAAVLGAVALWCVPGWLHSAPGFRLLLFQLAYMAIILALRFSGSAVRRDLGARPFLSTLPITPYQTLTGKIGALRHHLMPLWMLAALLGALSISSSNALEASWRLMAVCAALWLLCEAAVPIAFLSNGLGVPSVTALGASRSFANQLLSLPVFAVVAAHNALSALVSLALLAAVAMEARRAAERCVLWLDDAGDVPRDTPVWRMLLVLMTFFCAQALLSQLMMLFDTSQGWVLAVAYGGSSVVLFLLLEQQRDGQPWPRLLPARKASLLLGVAAGVLSAVLTHGLLAGLHRLGWTPDPSEQLSASGASFWAAMVAIVVLAPLAEETFFRGWLQTAIAAQLPAQRRAHAIAIGALAFAAVHFGSLYLPQLVLGLLAGTLYAATGGLLPGILAHAIHNALSLWWSSP